MCGKWGFDKYHLKFTVRGEQSTATLSGVQEAAKEILKRYGMPHLYTRCMYWSTPAAVAFLSSDEEEPERKIDPRQETIASGLQWNAANGLSDELWVAFGKGEKGAAGAVDTARVAGVPAEVLKVERVDESDWCSERDLEYVKLWSGRDKGFSRVEGGVWWPCAPPEGF